MNEFVEVWRPVEETYIDKDIYRINLQIIPKDEIWEFRPSDLVRVKIREAYGEKSLIAYEKIEKIL